MAIQVAPLAERDNLEPEAFKVETCHLFLVASNMRPNFDLINIRSYHMFIFARLLDAWWLSDAVYKKSDAKNQNSKAMITSS